MWWKKHVSGSRKHRLAAGGKTYSLSVGILWLLPSTTRCREGGAMDSESQRVNNLLLKCAIETPVARTH